MFSSKYLRKLNSKIKSKIVSHAKQKKRVNKVRRWETGFPYTNGPMAGESENFYQKKPHILEKL